MPNDSAIDGIANKSSAATIDGFSASLNWPIPMIAGAFGVGEAARTSAAILIRRHFGARGQARSRQEQADPRVGLPDFPHRVDQASRRPCWQTFGRYSPPVVHCLYRSERGSGCRRHVQTAMRPLRRPLRGRSAGVERRSMKLFSCSVFAAPRRSVPACRAYRAEWLHCTFSVEQRDSDQRTIAGSAHAREV